MTLLARRLCSPAVLVCALTLGGCATVGSSAVETGGGADLSTYADEVEANVALSFGADTMDGLCASGLSWPCEITDVRASSEGAIELDTTLAQHETIMAEKLARAMYAGDGGDHDLGSVTVYDSQGMVIDAWTTGDFPGLSGTIEQDGAQASDPVPTPEAVTAPGTLPDDVASPSMRVNPVTATEAVHRYVADEPWYGPQEMGTSIVDTVVVEGDDVIVTLVTDLQTNATTTYAPIILADVTAALRAHPDDLALQGIDLVAINTQDGGMATYQSLWGLGYTTDGS